MKAGRELDALISEKVMGFEMKDGKTVERWPNVPGVYTPHDPQPYSTDIKAAMKVVAAKNADIVEMVWHCDAEAWVVTFNDRHGPWAKTLPHAICLSALPHTRDAAESPEERFNRLRKGFPGEVARNDYRRVSSVPELENAESATMVNAVVTQDGDSKDG